MRIKTAVLISAVTLAGFAGCKHKTGTGGGGGGGWFVGTDSMMRNITDQGQLGAGYDIGTTGTLNSIACRYLDEAWVVGDAGTVLYTSDAGASWTVQNIGTTANLRSLATQDAGHVFVVGDGVFFTSIPDFKTGAASWQNLGDGTTKFLSVAAAQEASTVLAVSDGGGVWAFDNGALVQRTTLAGARAVAVSPDGETVIVAGAGLYRSLDAGKTFQKLTVDASLVFADVRVDGNGEAGGPRPRAARGHRRSENGAHRRDRGLCGGRLRCRRRRPGLDHTRRRLDVERRSEPRTHGARRRSDRRWPPLVAAHEAQTAERPAR